MNNRIGFLIIFVTLILLAVSSCFYDNQQSPAPTENPDPTATPNVTIEVSVGSKPEFREINVEVLPQPNCGGSAEVENTIERLRSIEHTMEVGIVSEVSAEGAMTILGTGATVGVSVAAEFNKGYGTTEDISRSITVKAQPRTSMEHRIKLQEVWEIGTALVVVDGKELSFEFSFRNDFSLELIESKDIGCQNQDQTSTPILPTDVPVTLTNTSVPPTNAPVPPTNTSVPPTNAPVPPTNTFVPPTNTFVPPTNAPVLPTNTFVPPTNAPVPPTNTFVPPTNAPAPPTNTFVPPTNESIPPTNTFVPPTNEPVPPTNTFVPPTNTFVPPTNTFVPPTNTFVPPTNTPVPPTNIPAPPTNTPAPPTEAPTQIEIPNDPGTIHPGSSLTDSLAKDAYKDYNFTGYTNTPVLFTIEVDQGVQYNIEFRDSKDFLLEEQGYYHSGDNPLQIPFTPQSDGQYTIRLLGRRGFGGYTVSMDFISGPPESRNQALPITLDTSLKGNLAINSLDIYSFNGSANTPLLFKVQVDQGLQYFFKIYDSSEQLLEEQGYYHSGDNPVQIPFTPQSDGQYTIRLLGRRGFGGYTVSMDFISGPPESRNQVLPITLETSMKGNLAINSLDIYSFNGSANTPLLFKVQVDQGLQYFFKIYDSSEQLLEEQGYYHSGDNPVQIPFTPQSDGQYTIRLLGRRGFGGYTVSMDFISGPPESRNQVLPITLETSVKGELAINSYDVYSFNGSANTPLQFTIQVDQGLQYFFKIYDSSEQLLEEQGYYHSGNNPVQIPFTPQFDGQFTIRLLGRRGFGGYIVAMSN